MSNTLNIVIHWVKFTNLPLLRKILVHNQDQALAVIIPMNGVYTKKCYCETQLMKTYFCYWISHLVHFQIDFCSQPSWVLVHLLDLSVRFIFVGCIFSSATIFLLHHVFFDYADFKCIHLISIITIFMKMDQLLLFFLFHCYFVWFSCNCDCI